MVILETILASRAVVSLKAVVITGAVVTLKAIVVAVVTLKDIVTPDLR